jgi:DNA-binding XRE family transcriptional regulator
MKRLSAAESVDTAGEPGLTRICVTTHNLGGSERGRKARHVMGTKFSDYLAESGAADTPEDAAVRAMFAAGIALGLQFRDARVSRGLTQAQLSGLTGIPQADISRIERGAGNPTESTMQRLAHALSVRLQLVAA